jgi:tannase
MKQSLILAGASVVSAGSLSSICSVDYIKEKLPTDNTALQGLVYGDVTANSVYNASVEAGNNYPAAIGRNFCNVTVAYKHDGKNDAVRLPGRREAINVLF